MICLVTGAAGFIGSTLIEKLIEEGKHVRGIDSLSRSYPERIKLDNISRFRKNDLFSFTKADLVVADLSGLLNGVDLVFHLAAQPGVRSSWGSTFSTYTKDNIVATQRLLEAVKGSSVQKLIYASSSSIYGDSERLPTTEHALPAPTSPYGVTKLAAEHLCRTYQKNFNIPIVILRYFTVYGPRQRPDMAFNKFIRGIAEGSVIQIFGDGNQSRDFTFVDDTVNATLLSIKAKPGSVFNVGTGTTTSLKQAVYIIESLVGKKAKISRAQPASGDVKKTSADISKIRRELGYKPSMNLDEGLRRQVEWQLKTG